MVRESNGSQVENGRSGFPLPTHAAATEAGFDQFFAPGFGHPAANREAGGTIRSVLHFVGVTEKLIQLGV